MRDVECGMPSPFHMNFDCPAEAFPLDSGQIHAVCPDVWPRVAEEGPDA